MTRAIVTGMPRSGTQYLANLLLACGVDAHHERVFNPDGGQIGRWTGVEISWMSAPYLDRPWVEGIPVLHVTRHPEAVLRSIVANLMVWFEANDAETPWRSFVALHAPEVTWPSDWTERAITWIEAWDDMIDAPRFHIEDLDAITSLFGLDPEHVQAASEEIGTSFNRRVPTAPTQLSDDVRERLGKVAAAWGYDPTLE